MAALSVAISVLGSTLGPTPGTAQGVTGLDTTFGANGRAVVAFPTASATATSLLVRPDGRIVVGGYVSRGSPNINFGLARLTPNGAVDGSFGVNGRSEADMGGADFANTSVLQPDGKILLAGRSTSTAGSFAVARTSATGSFDPSFDGDGKAFVDFPGEYGAQAMALQDDGKIVVVGSSSGSPQDETSENFAIARLNTDGALDTSFTATGKVELGFGGDDVARSVAVQSDGKIVVGGRTSANSGEMVLTRLLPTGQVDTSFGTSGAVFTGARSGGVDTGARGIALLPGGKILAVGTETYSGGTRFSIVQLNENGSFDASFGTNGRASVGFEIDFNGTPISGATARAVAVQPNGKIVVGGYRIDPNTDFQPSAATARLHPNGTLDTSFGDQGKAVFTQCRELSDLEMQSDGKVLFTGERCGADSGFTVFRLLGDPVTQQPPSENQPPLASFYYSPNPPHAGQRITLSDISSDPDGVIASVEWDLDGDGSFDDGEGSRVTWEFEERGLHQVGLRVTDDGGAVGTLYAGLTVLSPPRNTARPQITRRSGLLGNRFMCSTGRWTGLPEDPEFEYAWRRGTKDASRPSGYRWSVVGRGPNYLLKGSDVGATFACEVAVSNQDGRTSAFSNHVVLIKGDLDPFGRGTAYGNFRVRGIDVFQIVQPNSGARMFGYPDERFPSYCGGGTPTSWYLLFCTQQGPAQRVLYEGASLDVLKRTYAIVYVDMEKTAATDKKRQLEVVLTPRVDGKLLSNLALTRTITDPPVSHTPWVTTAERGNTRFGVEFQVPQLWLGLGAIGRLDLQARVRFPTSIFMEVRAPYQCDDQARNCAADDNFRLDDLLIYRTPVIQIETIGLRSKDVESIPGGDRVLRRAAQIFPGGEQWAFPPIRSVMDIREIVGWTLDSKPCKDIKAKSRRRCHSAYISRNLLTFRMHSDTDMLLAVHDYQTSNETGGAFLEPGWKITQTGTFETTGRPILTANSGTARRPLTAAAHEMGHAFASPHAGQDCDGTAPGQDQAGEEWPFDDQGRLQGAKFDVTSKRSAVTGRIVPEIDWSAEIDGAPLLEPPLRRFDLMSYCGGETTAWLSPRSWNRFFRAVRLYGERTGKLRTPASDITVETDRVVAVGVAGPEAGTITRLIPAADASVVPDPASGSPFRLRARDESGAVVEEVGVEVLTSSEGGPGEGAIMGALPAEAVVVELLHDSVVLHRIERSGPPTANVTAPGRGVVIRPSDELVVRWSSSDPDDDELMVSVDFSRTGGTSWRTVYEGPDEGSARISGRHLERSDRARIRVRVNDGFTQASALSPLFRTRGARPNVQIVTPAGGESLRVLERTVLSGMAIDDRGKSIPGRKLTWFAGSKKLGTGKEIRTRLPLGKVELRLVARDTHGRKGAARRTVRVQALPLQVTVLQGPERVRAKTRRFALKIAASGPGRLVVGRRSYRVGVKPRTIRVPVPRRPKSGLLEIPYELTPRSSSFRGRIRAKIAFVKA